jgi:predicted CopG family antitoxin
MLFRKKELFSELVSDFLQKKIRDLEMAMGGQENL